jgi:integrase
MRIRSVETMQANAGWRIFFCLKVTTDDGLVGWSEFNETFGSTCLSDVIRGLRWENVDLGHGTLTVPRSKNGRPRQVPLSAFAARVLRAQVGRRVDGNPLVFPSRRVEGRPLEGLRRIWDRAKRAAGLPAGQRIHDLRHSFASALANAGVPLFEIGTVLGHSQLSTTVRYAHHSPQRLVATADTAARSWNLLPGPPADGIGK